MQNKGPAPFLDHDFVYNSRHTGEFLNVHLEIKVNEDNMEFIIESDHLPEVADLTDVLATIQRDTLNKLKLDIWSDFKVILKSNGTSYEANLKPEAKEVLSIEPLK